MQGLLVARLWLLVVAGLAFLGSLLCVNQARPPVPPELWTDQPVCDRGELSQGEKVHATFDLVNHFPQPLEITKVVTGCTCSKAELSTKHVEPDDHLLLTVSWKTGTARGRSGTDLQVVFQLADGTRGSKILGIQGDVVPDVVYDPTEVVFINGKVASATVHFYPGRQKEFKIRKAFCNHAAFVAHLHGDESVRVTFQPDKWLAEDRSKPNLIVETDSLNEPQMILPLRVR